MLTLTDILHAARHLRSAGVGPKDLSTTLRGAIALLYAPHSP